MALRATGLFPAWFVVARELRPGHYIPANGVNGRQAPVKRCLARCCGRVFRGSCTSRMRARAKFGGSADAGIRAEMGPSSATPLQPLGSVREHLLNGSDVLSRNLRQLLELAHAFGRFGAQ